MKKQIISNSPLSSPPRDFTLIGTVYSLPTSIIHPMKITPFPIREDALMMELTDSILQFGVLHPIEVRSTASGNYEAISGARRLCASQKLGIEFIPSIILDLDDDEAIIRMVDSNIQREYLLPSERAYAYKMRMEATKRTAGRPGNMEKENSPKNSANFRSDDCVGEMSGISGDTVRNYILLTRLIPDLLKLVDERKIGLTPAYQISSLSESEQALLLDTIDSEQCTPSLSQAQHMRRLSQAGELNEDTMLQIMSEQNKPVKNNVTLPEDKLRKYFPRFYSPAKIEALVFDLLDAWHNTRCFFLLDGNYDHFYYLTNDHHGEVLIRLLCSSQLRSTLDRVLSQGLAPRKPGLPIEHDAMGKHGEPVLFSYLPDIPRLNRFHTALQLQERTGTVICFDYQHDVLRRCLDERTQIQTISFKKFEGRFFHRQR